MSYEKLFHDYVKSSPLSRHALPPFADSPCTGPWELAGTQQRYQRMTPTQAWVASRRGRISKEGKCSRISIDYVIKTARKIMSVS